MKIGIIGSRSRNTNKDRALVYDMFVERINQHREDLLFVSGGCPEGADAFAEEAAKYFGVSISIHYPKQFPITTAYGEIVERFYARNRKIANECDILYALVSSGRKGGTEYTIKQACGKQIILL